MNFFAVFVRKLEPFAKLERTLPPFLGRFRIESGCRWRFLCHSIVRYLRISRLQRGVEPKYWRSVRVLRRVREFP